MLQTSLRELGKSNVVINADNDDEQAKAQQIDLDIDDYRDLFADDYCRNLKADLLGQIAFIEKLEQRTKQATDFSDIIDFCSQEYAGLNLFMPKMTGLTSDTYFFDAKEFCTVFAQTITEIKSSEVDLGKPIISPEQIEPKTVRPEPFGLQDYSKALQVTAHELFIEK